MQTKVSEYIQLFFIIITAILINKFIFYDFWVRNLEKLPYLLLFTCLWAGISINSLNLRNLDLKVIKTILKNLEFYKIVAYSLIISPALAIAISNILGLSVGEKIALLSISIPLGSSLVIKMLKETYGDHKIKEATNIFSIILLLSILSIPILYEYMESLRKTYIKEFVSKDIELSNNIYGFFIYCPLSAICSSPYYISLLAIFVILAIPYFVSILSKKNQVESVLRKINRYGEKGVLFLFLIFPFAITIKAHNVIVAAFYYSINFIVATLYLKILKIPKEFYPFLVTRFVSIGITTIFLASYLLASIDYSLIEGSFEVLISYLTIQIVFTKKLIKIISDNLL